MRQFVTCARRAAAAASLLAAAGLLAGCEPLSLAALGIGGSAAVNHKVNGIPYRTFTAPLSRVRIASMGALKRMGIKAEGTTKIENGELITARAGKREIEVELESLTPNTTRMKVVARQGGVFYDSATASEIIAQTEKSLGV
ncbi:MAG: hypothetical protein A3G81_10845 [Betaproteobacteria bacterium RIFCSPLOWO2_12_FULL_65_14]|nr:MAG: hypothetical protein A3G81_10845 [Betaproteobacteria bacterium RIFCSPLOWO2_12_FULL_65_14]